MKTKKIVGMALAITAAAAFAATPIAATAHTKMVHCYGVNGCKGKGSCKGADNACKGQNSCKGKGMKMMSKKKCDKMGGTEQ